MPTSHIPFEILAKIFQHTDPTFKRPVLSDSETKWDADNLAGVCRQWRSVAVGTPRLWAKYRIYVDDPETSERFIIRSQTVANRLRHKRQPLDLLLSSIQPNLRVLKPYAYFPLFLEHAAEWEDVTLSARWIDLTQLFSDSDLGKDSFPNLERLVVLVGDHFPRSPPPPLLAFEHSFRLRELDLDVTCPYLWSIPWSSLSSVSLSSRWLADFNLNDNYSYVTHGLSQCSHLRSMALDGIYPT